MRWVKEILPPRLRRKWLLMTMRLSMSSFAGIVRTLVAVGTERLRSMFFASVRVIPRSGVTSSTASSGPSSAPAFARGASAGIGAVRGAAFVVRAGVAVLGDCAEPEDACAREGGGAAAGAAAVGVDCCAAPYFARTGHHAWSTEF